LYPKKRRETTYIFTPATTKKTYTCRKTWTPSNSIIGVDLPPIDMREFPNNLNKRDLFLTMHGDIKKLQIREVNNVIEHVFLGRITRHFDKTFNTLDSRADRNVFLKPNMISHPPYHPNRVSNSWQPNKIN